MNGNQHYSANFTNLIIEVPFSVFLIYFRQTGDSSAIDGHSESVMQLISVLYNDETVLGEKARFYMELSKISLEK